MWAEDDFDLEEILREESTAPKILQKALIEAAQNGNSERIQEILSTPEAAAQVDINATDDTGSNALIYATCYSSEPAVLELLRFGADPNTTDRNEWSPLMWAVQNQSLGVVQRLIDQGAEVSYKTESGRSAASICSHSGIVYQYFVSNGFIQDEGPTFYKPATDPSEEEARFQEKLEESSQALGIKFQGFDEQPILGGVGAEEELLTDDFDWSYNHSSFNLNPRLFPQFLDMVITTSVPFKKGCQPIAANCMFLVIRHYSYNPNEQALVGLVSSAIQRIQNVIESDDLKVLVYWLVNVHALEFYLKRDTTTNRETEEFQQGLHDLLQLCYNRVVECSKLLLQPLIKPCILDYENIPGIDSIQYRGSWTLWRKKESTPDDTPDILPPSMDALRKPAPRRVTAVLSSLMLVLEVYSVHPVIIQGIYSQILFWLGATLFNDILKSHRYMARVRAMQIRLNISNIEDWALNNNCRPSDDEFHEGPPTYKSLDQLCRMHFSCVAEMLQWLQCFSGFGSDFTNVIATMQELKELNPKQLLYAAKHYRSEINEPTLSKDYKQYLQDLEAHYSSTDHEQEEKDCILLKATPIVSHDILLDSEERLTIHPPSYKEMLLYWGGGADGTDVQSGHYFKPSFPAEIADELESKEDATDIYQPLEMPQAQQKEWEPEW